MSEPGSPPGHGVVTFEGQGKAWSLYFGINALCDLEQQVSDETEVAKLMNFSPASLPAISTIRAGFWAALKTHHRDVTLEDVGNLIDAISLPKAGQLIATALIAAFPKAIPDPPRKAARTKV